MAKNVIQKLLELQVAQSTSVDSYANLLKAKFDLMVDIKLFEVWLLDDETIDIREIEDEAFETSLLHDQLHELIEKIVLLEGELELMEQRLENL